MTYLDNVVEFHVNIIFPSICIEKLCITIFLLMRMSGCYHFKELYLFNFFLFYS